MKEKNILCKLEIGILCIFINIVIFYLFKNIFVLCMYVSYLLLNGKLKIIKYLRKINRIKEI